MSERHGTIGRCAECGGHFRQPERGELQELCTACRAWSATLAMHTETERTLAALARVRTELAERTAPTEQDPDDVPSAEVLSMELHRARVALNLRREPTTAKAEARRWLDDLVARRRCELEPVE